jgi:hypothetical protein
LPEIRNFIFESIFFDIIESEKKITAAIMNVYTAYVEIRNIINKSIIINRKRRLEIIEKYGIEKYYLITEKSKSLAIGRILWIRKILTVGILAFTTANLATTPPNPAMIIIEINISKKIITDFGIIVYGDITARQRFIQITKIYPDL